MKNLKENLKKQLALRGITNPESITCADEEELSTEAQELVSGGSFGQIVAHGQVYAQTIHYQGGVRTEKDTPGSKK